MKAALRAWNSMIPWTESLFTGFYVIQNKFIEIR